MGINHKNRMFSRLYKAIKIHLIALWALSQTQLTDFSTLSYTGSLKKIPLSGGASPYMALGITGSTPPPPQPLRVSSRPINSITDTVLKENTKQIVTT